MVNLNASRTILLKRLRLHALPNRFVTVWQCMQAQSSKNCALKKTFLWCDIIVRPRSKTYGATSFHIRWELSRLCRMSRARLASSENGAEGRRLFLVNLNASRTILLKRLRLHALPNRFVTVWQCRLCTKKPSCGLRYYREAAQQGLRRYFISHPLGAFPAVPHEPGKAGFIRKWSRGAEGSFG